MTDEHEIVRYEVVDRTSIVTLNRPEARNALSQEMLRLVPDRLLQADADPDVDVIILTGTDPAFCAGLDLEELGGGSLPIGAGAEGGANRHGTRGPFPRLRAPLIGAINGAAVTGGFELALNCDFLVASERATFGDTHARLGIMPGWGLTVLLSQAIGVRRAREMSFTGNFVAADEALRLGLVNHVVAHDELLAFTLALAADVAGNDMEAVRQLRSTYVAVTKDDDAWEQEARDSRSWARTNFSPERVAERRAAVEARGRAQ